MEDTTLKQVEALKERHRRDIWGDDDGYVWFWDIDLGKWTCLAPIYGGTRRLFTGTAGGYAPYTRIQKGWR